MSVVDYKESDFTPKDSFFFDENIETSEYVPVF